jgi:hypothetical protein
MKKRLPILFVFFGVFLLGGIIWVNSNFSEPPKVVDSDGDGFPDDIDPCDKVSSVVNNGCPEKGGQLKTDLDKDGFFSDFQRDASKIDPDDNNACIPNSSCEICDADRDGLNLKEELSKGTLNNKKDTDQDGVDDPVDRCPTKPGVLENQGCNLVLSANLSSEGTQISWNEKLPAYAEEIYLSFGDRKISVKDSYQHNLLSDNVKKGRVYDVEFIVKLKDPLKVQLSGNTKLRIKIPQ